MTIASKVRERIDHLGSNPAEIARRAGLARTFVSDLLAGKKKSVRGDGLIALASALECDPQYLTGDQPSPRAPRRPAEIHPLTDDVRVLGVCEAGVWRTPGSLPDLGTLPGCRDPRLADRTQVAFLARGNAAASVWIADGMMVCGIVPVDDGESDEGFAGAPLVVRQSRSGVGEETSIRVIEVGLRGARLISPDRDPMTPPIPYPTADRETRVEILAIVTKAVKLYGGWPN